MADFLDVTVYPDPNPALTGWLVGPECRRIMEERANMAMLLYQAQVAKRTGRLARSARAHVEIGGDKHDRWVGELIVGDDPGVDYAASHEFGVEAEIEGPAKPKLGKRGKPLKNQKYVEGPVITGDHHAAHDLNVVLSELGNF